MSEIKDEDYGIKDVQTPRSGVFKVYVNYFWWCEDGDPTKAIFYKDRWPQCNADIAVLENMEQPYDGCEIVQVPVSYIEWNG